MAKEDLTKELAAVTAKVMKDVITAELGPIRARLDLIEKLLAGAVKT